MARLRGEAKRSWERTLRLYDRLTSGGSPGVIDVDDVNLASDEVCFAEMVLLLSTPSGVQRSVIYEEYQRPFTLNPFRRARDAMDRAANRAEFERLSRELAESSEFAWFDRGTARVVLTNTRLVCDHDGRRFEYRHEHLRGLELDIDGWAVELRYDGAEPIRLAGWSAFAIGLVIVWLLDGPESLAGPDFEAFQ